MISKDHNNPNMKMLTYILTDYISPGCHCNLEDKISEKFHGIHQVNLNPLNNELQIHASNDFDSVELEQWFSKCGYNNQKIYFESHENLQDVDHSKMKHEMDKNAQMDHSEHEDHGNHHANMVDEFRIKTYLVLIASIPVLLLSPTVQDWLNLDIPDFGLNTAILVILATFIVIYGTSTFFWGGSRSIRAGILDMNVLVSLAVLSGYLFSLATTFIFENTADFYWEISTLVLFLDFGHWMEMRAVAGASGALNSLVKLIPKN